ncbi:MAG: c-type cytochrome [Bacteroidota bacterium]
MGRSSLLLMALLGVLLVACLPDKSSALLDGYEIEKGFELKVLAAEPMLNSPVAMDVDLEGRMWVVEMPGYMANIDGTGEEEPNGRILVLSDEEGNGKIDKVHVFLDSLVLPRALLLAYGGLLYAEPPYLWFVEIGEDLKAGKRTLVDSTYAGEGNIEHLPNSLTLNMDNWIYSAKSNMRYRLREGKWEKEFTAFRGQWGMSHDNHGILYYNNNSSLLLQDKTYPQAALQNRFYKPSFAINQMASPNNRVYPLHATLMNRGYVAGVLDEEGKLVNTSAAAGPVIYRGGIFGEEYDGDAFVSVPEANLIKRIKLNGRTIEEGNEFLRSTDPLFRPVSLANGPDGSLYVVDMHRGIIQHQAYMTSYLREKILAAGLDTAVGMGRILAISPKNSSSQDIPDFRKATPYELTRALVHPNGWVRDKAQHLLIQKRDTKVLPALEIMALTNVSPYNLHGFWVLEGQGLMDQALAEKIFKESKDEVVVAALYAILEKDWEDLSFLEGYLPDLMAKKSLEIDRYLAGLIPRLEKWDFLLTLMARHEGDPLLKTMALSGMKGKEISWRNYLMETESQAVQEQWLPVLDEIIEAINTNQPFMDLSGLPDFQDNRTNGLILFRKYCSTCHGMNGRGMENLAPSLMEAKHIHGPDEGLALLLLNGIKGPIQRGQTTYEFAAQMPGLGDNPNLSDEDISDIIAYIRNAFSQQSTEVPPSLIQKMRQVEVSNDQGLTEELLEKMVNKLQE